MADMRLTKPDDASIKSFITGAAGEFMQAAGHSAGNGARNGALGETIAARLLELAAITDEPGHLTRLYLSPAHRKAADLVAAWMREAGMTAQIDALGNVVGRYDARNPGARTLLLGSHIDTVRNAGRFDGALGVVTAVEAVKAASKSAKRFAFAIEVVAFGDEEGVRFASTLGGAKALAGKFAASALDETDDGGVSRRQALMAFGCDPSRLRELTASAERTLGYVEVHIEQGPVLEQENLPVGIVTAIAGVTRATVEIDGVAGHAGTVPMPLRKDALMAAAEMLLAVEAAARSRPGLVATVGKLEVPASATNTIPGRVCFTLDIRSASDRERIDAVAAIRQSLDAIARRRGVSARVLIGHEVPAAVCDHRLSDQLAAAIESFGIAPRRLPSGAGHDAMAFDKVIPFAMLFVRCRGGISHNPDEYASPADIDIAAGVLLNFLERIESQ